MSVSLNSYEHGGVLTIEMSGPLTILDRSLRDTVLKFLDAGKRHFILKMADVPHIDSSGLSQLIFVYSAIKKVNGTMQLLAPSKRLRDRLRVTQLDSVFDIVEDAAAA